MLGTAKNKVSVTANAVRHRMVDIPETGIYLSDDDVLYHGAICKAEFQLLQYSLSVSPLIERD